MEKYSPKWSNSVKFLLNLIFILNYPLICDLSPKNKFSSKFCIYLFLIKKMEKIKKI